MWRRFCSLPLDSALTSCWAWWYSESKKRFAASFASKFVYICTCRALLIALESMDSFMYLVAGLLRLNFILATALHTLKLGYSQYMVMAGLWCSWMSCLTICSSSTCGGDAGC